MTTTTQTTKPPSAKKRLKTNLKKAYDLLDQQDYFMKFLWSELLSNEFHDNHKDDRVHRLKVYQKIWEKIAYY